MRRFARLALLAWLTIGAEAAAEPLVLDVRPIANFSLAGLAEPAGKLQVLGGLYISSENPDFGGFSGIDMLDDGTAFLIADSGSFMRARLVHENGRLAGIASAEIGPLFPDGDMSKDVGDAEDVAFDPADRRKGVIVRERQPNAMLAFTLDEGRPGGFQPKLVGADDRILRSNKGLESVAYAPETSPIAGEIVAIAERHPRGAEAIPGWIAGKGAFEIVPHDNFDVSSARFLPDGDLILLERRYLPWGIGARLRRIDGDTIEVGARIDGEYLLDAGITSQIDNMEGLAIHRDEAGRTVLTLVSDDNHSILQRTLILQFELAEN